ncbi:Dolichyl-diphosphooligosaccharide--protein glycosyltransferase 48 kDa subunit [Balamuthia mandrillaris]
MAVSKLQIVLLVLAAFALCELFAATTAASASAARKRGLVLLDDLKLRNTHSQFFGALSHKYDLSFFESTDPELELSRYGVYLYDFIVLFAPRTIQFGGSINVDAILNFIDDGHSLLVAVNNELDDPVREVALECGVLYGDDEGSFLVDHFHFDQGDFDGAHTLVVSRVREDVPSVITSSSSSAPLLFRGVGASLEAENELLIRVADAYSTSYVHSPYAEVKSSSGNLLKGRDISLIAALQARNNARVTFVGSLDFFSDRFFDSPVQPFSSSLEQQQKWEKSGNEELAMNLVAWTFGEKGVLRSSNPRHHLVGHTEQPSLYTIRDEVEYEVEVEEWDGSKGEWVPYISRDDLQVEAAMLDPYIRTFLQPSTNASSPATYRARFVLPDQYGVFTFRLNYHRKGYSSLHQRQMVTVRPLRHDQYERFILSAYPYYAGAFSMMAGFFVFSWFFLYSTDKTHVASSASK